MIKIFIYSLFEVWFFIPDNNLCMLRCDVELYGWALWDWTGYSQAWYFPGIYLFSGIFLLNGEIQ